MTKKNERKSSPQKPAPKSADRLKPGQTVEKSGQYAIAQGAKVDPNTERTMVKGDTAPPVPKKGQTLVLRDPTKNGAGQPAKKK